MIKNLTRENLDKLCDILWWFKGYVAGAKDSFENCPFDENHITALSKAIKNEKELTHLGES